MIGEFRISHFYKATAIGYGISAGLHLLGLFVLAATGTTVEQQNLRVTFNPPPPILQKSFELAKRPEISEVQMEMLQSIASQPELSQDLFALGRGTGGSSDLLGGGPATSLGTMSRAGLEQLAGAKAAGPAFEQVKMVELANAAAPSRTSTSAGTRRSSSRTRRTRRTSRASST
jgi:hypothetical protein